MAWCRHGNKLIMGFLPDTENCGLRMRRECRERFLRHRIQRTHVPWCMPGSLTSGDGKSFPAFPVHAKPAILRICQEAHGNNNGPVLWRHMLSLLYCHLKHTNIEIGLSNDFTAVLTFKVPRDFTASRRSFWMTPYPQLFHIIDILTYESLWPRYFPVKT